MKRLLLIAMLLSIALGAMCQSSGSIRNSQRSNRQRITQTRRQQADNEATLARKLHDLELFESQISDLNAQLRTLQHTHDSIIMLIIPVRDSVNMLNERLETMRSRYIQALKRSQATRTGTQTGALSFIFTSHSFSQAWQRYRSLQQFARWQRNKSAEINLTRQVLDQRKARLDSLNAHNTTILAQTRQQRDALAAKRAETDRLVASLRSQSRNLDKLLAKYEKRARELDRKLEEAIQRELEEQRRREEAERRRQQQAQQQPSQPDGDNTAAQPLTSTTTDANRQLSNDFESNKGRLPFPVRGNYNIVKKFGRQQHPRLPKIQTENAGIDIEATSSAAVHTVFKGEVSQIFKLQGLQNVIVLRHGNYLTVYAGISSLKVKKGDMVDTGQQLGTLWADPNDGNRSILHFELRHEKEKMNPEQWLKP